MSISEKDSQEDVSIIVSEEEDNIKQMENNNIKEVKNLGTNLTLNRLKTMNIISQSNIQRKSKNKILKNLKFLYEKYDHKKESLLICEADKTFEKFLESISIDPITRSSKEVFLISEKLMKTELFQNLNKSIPDEAAINKILLAISYTINLQVLPNNEVLFKIGDQGNKFFVIFKGKVSILKLKEKIQYLTFREYYDHINEFVKKDEKYIVNKTLFANKLEYDMDINKMDLINDIMLENKIRSCILNLTNLEDVKKLLEEFDDDLKKDLQGSKNFNNLALSTDNIFSDNFLNNIDSTINNYEDTEIKLRRSLEIDKKNIMTDIRRYLFKSISVLKKRSVDWGFKNTARYILSNKISILLNKNEKKKVVIYEYEHIASLSKGSSFGEYALDSNASRSATILGEDDVTYLGEISLDIYNEFIKSEKEKIKNREIQFLIDNFIFPNIRSIIFEKNYFLYFLKEEYSKGEILFRENEEINFVYFIREGEVELSLKKDIIEVSKFINSLKMLINSEKKNCFLDEYKCETDPRDFLIKLLTKSNFKLFLFGAKEMLGLIEYKFNLNRLFQATVKSEKLKLYKIDINVIYFIKFIKKLNSIIKRERDLESHITRIVNQRILLFVNRLIEIKNYHISLLNSNNLLEVKRNFTLNLNPFSKPDKKLRSLKDFNIISQNFNSNSKNINNLSFRNIKERNSPRQILTYRNSSNDVENLTPYSIPKNDNEGNIILNENMSIDNTSNSYIQLNKLPVETESIQYKPCLTETDACFYNNLEPLETKLSIDLKFEEIKSLVYKQQINKIYEKSERNNNSLLNLTNNVNNNIKSSTYFEDLILKKLKKGITIRNSINSNLFLNNTDDSVVNNHNNNNTQTYNHDEFYKNKDKVIIHNKIYQTALPELGYKVNYILSNKGKVAKISYQNLSKPCNLKIQYKDNSYKSFKRLKNEDNYEVYNYNDKEDGINTRLINLNLAELVKKNKYIKKTIIPITIPIKIQLKEKEKIMKRDKLPKLII